VNTVMNLRVPQNNWNILTNWETTKGPKQMYTYFNRHNHKVEPKCNVRCVVWYSPKNGARHMNTRATYSNGGIAKENGGGKVCIHFLGPFTFLGPLCTSPERLWAMELVT
jgi:hypothetical protein